MRNWNRKSFLVLKYFSVNQFVKNKFAALMMDLNMETGDDSKTPGRQKLESWLNKNMKIKMTDERILVGVFVCTDKDRNVILGNCQEYLKDEDSNEEPRVLGLAMVPGHHIVSILVDENKAPLAHHEDTDIL